MLRSFIQRASTLGASRWRSITSMTIGAGVITYTATSMMQNANDDDDDRSFIRLPSLFGGLTSSSSTSLSSHRFTNRPEMLISSSSKLILAQSIEDTEQDDNISSTSNEHTSNEHTSSTSTSTSSTPSSEEHTSSSLSNDNDSSVPSSESQEQPINQSNETHDASSSSPSSSPPSSSSSNEATVESLSSLLSNETPVIVTISAIRAAEFIELEKHYREEMERIIQEKEKQLEHQLQLTRKQLELEFENSEYMEQYKREIRHQLVEVVEKLLIQYTNHFTKFKEGCQMVYYNKLRSFVDTSTNEINQRAALLRELNDRVRSLEETIASHENSMAADLRSQKILLALFALSSRALDHAGPFQAQLRRTIDASQGHSVIQQALTAIPESVSISGIRTLHELHDQFQLAKRVGRREALVPPNGGSAWRVFATFISAITIPVRGWVQGDDPDAIFARAEYLLEHGDLRASIDEVSKLTGAAALIMSDWIRDAKNRLIVEQSISVVRNYVASSIASADSVSAPLNTVSPTTAAA